MLISFFFHDFIFIFIVGIGALIKSDDYPSALYVLGISQFIGIIILKIFVRDPKKPGDASFHLEGFSS